MRRSAAAPAALVALAVAARLPGVWTNALSQDEVASARILREPTALGALHRVVRTESTPPLWYAAGWLLHHLGLGLVDVRLLSVAYGGLLALAVLALGRRVLPPQLALAAAALVAVGYQPVYHGSELRAYAQLTLLAALLALVLLRRLERPPRLRDDATLGAVVWAGSMTHYFFAYSVVAALAWLWLDPAARPQRRRATVAIAAGGALALPWLPAFLVQLHADRFWWIPRFSASIVAATPLRLFVAFRHQSTPLVALALAHANGGWWVLARRAAAGRLLVALGAGPLVLAATVWAAGERNYSIRNLLETAPFLALAGAAALTLLPRRTVVPAAAALAVAIASIAVPEATLLPPYARLAQTLVDEGWQKSDPIAVVGNVFSFRAPLEWYLPHAPLLDISEPTGRACSTVFVIARARARLPRGAVIVKRRAGGYVVARLDGSKTLRPLARATLLAPLGHAPPCARPTRNPHLQPLA